eukprot:TRINITY_DN21193_c1_g1_i1.p1 TRINITY_DN21193_c1_g1~~TRINITY_DN21193_c1_g1_i1.p1  ORF type:complete len:138 (+),score=18.07 TRINITY_DN21193_c1_g1_i1:291-704(+)
MQTNSSASVHFNSVDSETVQEPLGDSAEAEVAAQKTRSGEANVHLGVDYAEWLATASDDDLLRPLNIYDHEIGDDVDECLEKNDSRSSAICSEDGFDIGWLDSLCQTSDQAAEYAARVERVNAAYQADQDRMRKWRW